MAVYAALMTNYSGWVPTVTYKWKAWYVAASSFFDPPDPASYSSNAYMGTGTGNISVINVVGAVTGEGATSNYPFFIAAVLDPDNVIGGGVYLILEYDAPSNVQYYSGPFALLDIPPNTTTCNCPTAMCTT